MYKHKSYQKGLIAERLFGDTWLVLNRNIPAIFLVVHFSFVLTTQLHTKHFVWVYRCIFLL